MFISTKISIYCNLNVGRRNHTTENQIEGTLFWISEYAVDLLLYRIIFRLMVVLWQCNYQFQNRSSTFTTGIEMYFTWFLMRSFRKKLTLFQDYKIEPNIKPQNRFAVSFLSLFHLSRSPNVSKSRELSGSPYII